jgi:hypothetical protein
MSGGGQNNLSALIVGWVESAKPNKAQFYCLILAVSIQWWTDRPKMMGYDGLLNLSQSKDCHRLTHPT